MYSNMTNGCNMMWNFLGVDMVKDLGHDGARVVIKRFIQREQLNAHGTKLQNAEDVVNFLCANISDHLKSSYMGKKKPLCQVF